MKNIESIYKIIEAEIPTVEDLLAVPIEENQEKVVQISETDGVVISFHNAGATADLIGRQMVVRQTVRDKLLQVRDELALLRVEFALKIFYTYRALSVQKSLYDSALARSEAMFPGKPRAWQLQYAHTLAAKPEVAGHPTGAAVDLTLYDFSKDEDVDMGVPIYRDVYRNAGRKIYTESPEISNAALENRMLLRGIMQDNGFAPFSGEFWHFSFGDREWAAKLGKPKATYGQLSVEKVLRDLEGQKG